MRYNSICFLSYAHRKYMKYIAFKYEPKHNGNFSNVHYCTFNKLFFKVIDTEFF